MREDRREVEAAREKRLPLIIARSDIRGDLHTHTRKSDGTATIEEMAAAAKALGYEFLAIHARQLTVIRAVGTTGRRDRFR